MSVVVALRRFPVKSLLGEDLDTLDLDLRGVVGDRAWSIRTSDNKIGSGKSTRRFAAVIGLLQLRAHTTQQGVTITLPTGEQYATDDPDAAEAISRFLKQPVTIKRETDVSHFDDGPVSLIGTASVAALAAEVKADVDDKRFRANILVDGLTAFAEDDLVGKHIRIGTATLEVAMRSPRCVMIDMESADLPEQHGNLLAAGRLNEACLGVIANVVEPGTIRRGDRLIM